MTGWCVLSRIRAHPQTEATVVLPGCMRLGRRTMDRSQSFAMHQSWLCQDHKLWLPLAAPPPLLVYFFALDWQRFTTVEALAQSDSGTYPLPHHTKSHP